MAPVLAELGLDHEVHGSQAATVRDGDLTFNVTLRAERHFLMRIEVAEFTVLMKLASEVGRIELGHSGKRKRTGVTARPVPDRPDLKAIGERLVGSRAFEGAFLGLDSKRAIVELDPGLSVGRIRHIGFSRVVMAFPPTKKYITAGPDQVEALLATLRELARFE
ncbi:hypothetical protein BH23ACT4_BH23ACT4_12340 [soil metagenome]